MQSASNVLEQPQPAAPRTQSGPEVVSITPELPVSNSPLRAFKNRDFLLFVTRPCGSPSEQRRTKE